MRREVYSRVSDTINAQTVWDFDALLNELREKFPGERFESLRSIAGQKYTDRVKESYRRQNHREIYQVRCGEIFFIEVLKGLKYFYILAEPGCAIVCVFNLVFFFSV